MALCLVVDDDEMVCDLAARSLRALGMQVLTCLDGDEALSFCKVRMPDLVILDMKMPIMDGFEFLKFLREMEGGNAVKIIACTGMNDIETVKTLKASGIVDYLVKPFDNQLLIKKVVKLRLF